MLPEIIEKNTSKDSVSNSTCHKQVIDNKVISLSAKITNRKEELAKEKIYRAAKNLSW